MQIFAGLEADGTARCNADFGSGTRVAPDAGFAGPHVEHAETTQLDAIPVSQRALEALEDGFDSSLGFYAGQSGTLNYLMYDVLLNQWLSPETRTRNAASLGIEKMLERIFRIVNAWLCFVRCNFTKRCGIVNGMKGPDGVSVRGGGFSGY